MVSVPFAGHSFTTPILPERHAIDLGDLAVDRLEPDAMDADRRVAQGIAHQRENAGRGVGAERAARMESQALVDVSRQLAQVDAAGLAQVAFAQAPLQELGGIP